MTSRFAPSIKQLRAFVSVYQLKKLSAAGEQLALTQSAISVLIRQLEEGLGTRLFDRTTRSLSPTQSAHELVSTAERIIRDIDSLGAGLKDTTRLRKGRVCIAVTPTLGEILLPEAVHRFSVQYPEIQLMIEDCAPDQFMSRVMNDRVDFGIGTPEQMAADVDLETLVKDQLCLVCLPGHPLARRKSIPWKQLDGVPVITIRPGYGIRPLIELAALKAGIRLNIVNEVTFLSTALWMVQAGLAAAIMPSAYVKSAASGQLRVIPLSAARVTRNIYLIRKRGQSLSSAAQLFAAHLKEMF